MAPILGIMASQVSGHLYAASYESIATSGILNGTTNSVTFSSIPSTYTHLQIRFTARSERASANDLVYFRFNGDSANNYSWHTLYGDGANPYAQGYSPDSVALGGYIAGASSTSNIFGTSVVDILDYANTNKFKTTRALYGYDTNGAGITGLYSSSWRSTSAVSTIFLANYYTGANFTAGSRFDLYGIKGVA